MGDRPLYSDLLTLAEAETHTDKLLAVMLYSSAKADAEAHTSANVAAVNIPYLILYSSFQ